MDKSREHYLNKEKQHEFEYLEECEENIKNIGWTLGNDCPYKCKHCYSMSAREKGKNLNKGIIDKVVANIEKLNVATVNLGGNEPIFTNGLDATKSLLPYIVEQLDSRNIKVGLTTSGITAIYLEKHHNDIFKKLNDIDISLDSPFEKEHNENRGNDIYKLAIKALELCNKYHKDCTIIICAMKWNFTEDRIRAFVQLAKKYNANIRFNMMKPVEEKHLHELVTVDQYYEGHKLLNELCDVVDLTEPVLAGKMNKSDAKRCPCGRTSFRIHSITPTGEIPISPCVYLHDYKVGNLLIDDILELINSYEFKTFRRRNKNPEHINGCANCELLYTCGGGCAAMAYLYNLHKKNTKSLFNKDPYCPKDVNIDIGTVNILKKEKELVHMDYLCTWIGVPKK